MKRILLIEDDTVLRENTVELLELSNYNIISASNGKDIPPIIAVTST